jgi:hypothetical protein
MPSFINGVNNRNLDITSKGTLVEELTESLDFSKDFSVAKSQDYFVDVKLKFSTVSISDDYTVDKEDTFIGVDTSSKKITVTLYEGAENDKVMVKDTSGNARNFDIIVVPSGSDSIDGHQEVRLGINNIGIQFLYADGQWRML